MAALALGGLVVVGVVVYAIANQSDDISESKWRMFEQPGCCKILLPGRPEQQNKNLPAGLAITSQLVNISRSCAFAVGYTSEFTLDRLTEAPDMLLNQMCDECVKDINKQFAVIETRRESISFGKIPGRQIEMDAPKFGSHLIVRYYLTTNRVYLTMAGGRNYTVEHPDVKRFHDSFEILDKQSNPPPVQAANPVVDPPKIKQPPVGPPKTPTPKVKTAR
jgi:hypothetical protein